MQKSNKPSMTKAIKKVLARKVLNQAFHPAQAKTLRKEVKQLSDFMGSRANPKRSGTTPTSYLAALTQPEYVVNAKVPHQLSKETISLSRHITVPITVNILGNAAILFSPFFLKEDTTGATTLYVNNDATYNGSSTFGVGYTGLLLPMIIPAANVSAYRLVSASMHIVPQMSLTTSNGKIGGCVSDLIIVAGPVGGNTLAYNTAAVIANIESLRPYAESDVCIPESLRLCWFPYDNNDLCLYDINQEQQLGASGDRENVFMAYITGAPASGKFNIELFWNFEITTTPGSILSGMGCYAEETTDAIDILRIFKQRPDSIAHSYVSTFHKHQSDGRSFALSTGNPITVAQKNLRGGGLHDMGSYFG